MISDSPYFLYVCYIQQYMLGIMWISSFIRNCNRVDANIRVDTFKHISCQLLRLFIRTINLQ